MRPDDRDPFVLLDGVEPIEPDLVDLVAELEAAGALARARAADHRPDPAFAARLRASLLTAAAPAVVGGPELGAGPFDAAPGRAWEPAPLAPRMHPGHLRAPAPGSIPPARRFRRVALLAAAAVLAALAGVAAAGALHLDRLFVPAPAPSASPSPAPSAASSLAPASDAPVLPVPTAWFSAAPSELPAGTPSAVPTTSSTAKPSAAPKPKATPALGTLGLSTYACPGGIRLDVTDPGGATDHYRVMKLVGGGTVPGAWPADPAFEVGTAPGGSAGTTDGFDADLTAGASVSYRAFAFDAAGRPLTWSVARSAVAVATLDLGTPTAVPVGPGSMTFSWTAPAVGWDCFSFGKLVASATDPDPSYLTASPYLAVMGSPTDAGVTLDGLPSGKTVYLRYEAIRSTSTGLFVVGRTNVIQVTFP